jgi:hypothetical protein
LGLGRWNGYGAGGWAVGLWVILRLFLGGYSMR